MCTFLLAFDVTVQMIPYLQARRVEAVNPYDADPDFQGIVDVPVTVGWRK